jgi:hypothetical protein
MAMPPRVKVAKSGPKNLVIILFIEEAPALTCEAYIPLRAKRDRIPSKAAPIPPQLQLGA